MATGGKWKRRLHGFWLCLACACLPATGSAAVLFSQDYESGLSPLESVGGDFAINHNPAGNGSSMMGHGVAGYRNGARDSYSLTLDLLSIRDPWLTFDFIIAGESSYDGFVLLANGLLLAPISGFAYDTEPYRPRLQEIGLYDWIGRTTLDGSWRGMARFDLAGYAGDWLTLEWRFGSDESVATQSNPAYFGMVWDNLMVTGTDLAESGKGDSAAIAAASPLWLFLLGLAGMLGTKREGR